MDYDKGNIDYILKFHRGLRYVQIIVPHPGQVTFTSEEDYRLTMHGL